MQQTVDAVAETKDLTDVDVDLVTTLASGLFYSFYAVAVTAGVLTVADAVVEMTACGSSSCCSSVAASAATTEVAADADATSTATRLNLTSKKLLSL